MDAVAGESVLLERLFDIAEWQHEIPWEPLRTGVDIHWLYQSGAGPCSALLRYQENATVPLHRHSDCEHILVLCGSQADRLGCRGAGSLLISPPGSEHEILSRSGCIVLAVWQRREDFLPG